MKINVLAALAKLNPLKPLEGVVNQILFSSVKKLLLSSLKSVLTALVAGLSLFLGAPAPTDQAGLAIWGAILLGARTLISVLGHVLEQVQAKKV
jgi:hypothetical protein